MKYAKPEIAVLGCAVKAIETLQTKVTMQVSDHINGTFDNDGPAYEADE